MNNPPQPAGGPAARALLGALYAAHRQRVYAFLWARTRSREDALDLLQDVFVRAWRHADALAALGDAERAYWLFACARRVAIDHSRHAAVVRRAATSPALRPARLEHAGPAEGVEASDALRALAGAIRALPRGWREVLALTVLGEMTSAEVGVALGIPPATARYRLRKARQALQRALAVRHGAGPSLEAKP